MLTLTIPASEIYNTKTEEFITVKEQKLVLEHSLVSVAKWEAKWRKPFLATGKDESRTLAEIVDYIRCMTISQNVDPNVYKCITSEHLSAVNDYIGEPMSATWFGEDKRNRKAPPRKKEVITAEIIYYWMISLNIPFECQKWHLNRLLTLIRVCNIKNSASDKKNKMSKRSILSQNAALNKARRERLNTTG